MLLQGDALSEGGSVGDTETGENERENCSLNRDEAEIAYEAEAFGCAPGSAAYDRKTRELRVLKCQEYQKVNFCSECRAHLDCELYKSHLRDVAFGGSDGKPG